MRKPVILAFCDYYLPGYKAGGTPRTVVNLIEHIGDQLSFRVVTRDRDQGDAAAYPACPIRTWTPVGKAEVMYLPPHELNLRTLRRVIGRTEHDAMYLSSFFHPRLTIQPLLLRRLGLIPSRPVIVAPHGELKPAALKMKAAKKSLFLRLVKAVRLYEGLLWQASCDEEEKHIRAQFGRKVEVVVARDLPSACAAECPRVAARAKRQGTLQAAFLSRVSREKNLDGALRLLARVKGQVEFHVYGPHQDAGYWSECRHLIEALPDNIRVLDHGPVPASEVVVTLRQHHILLLPTFGENFGHVILESLLAGCPVLISDQTPWRGLEEKGVGWAIPLSDSDAFVTVLQRCVHLGNEEFQVMSARARQYGADVAGDPEVVSQNISMFSSQLRMRVRAA